MLATRPTSGASDQPELGAHVVSGDARMKPASVHPGCDRHDPRGGHAGGRDHAGRGVAAGDHAIRETIDEPAAAGDGDGDVTAANHRSAGRAAGEAAEPAVDRAVGVHEGDIALANEPSKRAAARAGRTRCASARGSPARRAVRSPGADGCRADRRPGRPSRDRAASEPRPGSGSPGHRSPRMPRCAGRAWAPGSPDDSRRRPSTGSRSYCRCSLFADTVLRQALSRNEKVRTDGRRG